MTKNSFKKFIVASCIAALSCGIGFAKETKAPQQINLDLSGTTSKPITSEINGTEGLSQQDKYGAKEKGAEILNSSSSSSSGIFNSAVGNSITFPIDKVKKKIMNK